MTGVAFCSSFHLPTPPSPGPVKRAGTGLGWQSDYRISGKCCLVCSDEKDPHTSLGLALLNCDVHQGRGVGNKSTVPGAAKPINWGSLRLQKQLGWQGRAGLFWLVFRCGRLRRQATIYTAAGANRVPTNAVPSAPCLWVDPQGEMLANTGASPPAQPTHPGHMWLMLDTEAQGSSPLS